MEDRGLPFFLTLSVYCINMLHLNMQASIGRGALHQYGRTDAICLLILQHAFSSKHSERYFTFEHKSSIWHRHLTAVQYPFLDIG